MKHSILYAIAIAMLVGACTEDTSTLGIYSETDQISSECQEYDVLTRSHTLGAVCYTGASSYLGHIVDPETHTPITACFAAQFHSFENFQFPDKALVKKDDQGHPVCDGIEMRLFHDSYFGDGNNPMKMQIYKLSKEKCMEESMTYYTDTDLGNFLDDGAEPFVTKVFTPIDYILSDDERNSSSYSKSIHIKLPNSFGNEIINAYYQHPEYFKDSYAFIHNVCPGLYFKITNGAGTMMRFKVGSMNLDFTYFDEAQGENVSARVRFAATGEVIQSTQFTSGDIVALVDKYNAAESDTTYLKSPAGIATEVTLPINKIFQNHERDSISKATLALTRINNKAVSKYSFDIPEEILMVRKKDEKTFFKNKEVANSQTSFITSLSPANNTYTFNNIGRLITYCHLEKQNEMQKTGLSEAEWESQNPDWNKVLLIPVSTSTTSDAYGNKTLVSVTHEMGLTSTRLIRGTEASPLKIRVIYSNFN